MITEFASRTGGQRAARLLWAGIFPRPAIAPGPGVRYCAHSMKRFWQIWALAAVFVLSLGTGAARAEPQNVATSITLSGTAPTTTAVYAQGVGEAQLLLVADSANNQLRTVEVRTGEEITAAALDLSGSCNPQDLLASGSTLYVACMGSDVVEMVDLSSFALPDPTLSSLGTVAVGEGPNRLLIAGNGADDYLVVQNVTEKSASVISLSSMNAPIAINADDSTEAMGAPVNVRLCGADADPVNRATPVGLGVGFERFYVGCDDGVVSWFDPFNNMDFSLSSETPALGVGALAAAFGRSGEHGLFLQATDGALYVVDLSEAEIGGNAFAQVLYNDGLSDFYSVAGPASPRGLLTFFDPETGSRWLALLGDAQVDLFDVGDLDDAPYTAPLSRTADAQFTAGHSAIGSSAVRPVLGSGNLFVPTGGADVNVLISGPIPTFTGPSLAISGQADPGLGLCDASFPSTNLSVPWSAVETVDDCTATLKKDTDEVSIACTTNGTAGMAEISPSAITDLVAMSDYSGNATVRLALSDALGSAAFGSSAMLIDGGRPDAPTGISGHIVNGTLYVNWTAAEDPGDALASGVRGYIVEIVRDTDTFYSVEVVGGLTSLATTIEAIDPMQDPLTSSDVLTVSVATCDEVGNRSAALSAPVAVGAALFGTTAALGEVGGCVLSRSSSGALLPLLLIVALAGVFIWYRRGSVR